MVRDRTIADAVAKMVDKPFALADPPNGWDCLNSLNEFYEACGVKFPRQFEQWNEQNYSQKWSEDSVEGRQAFFRFLSGLGAPVKKNYELRGDLLILQVEKQCLDATKMEKVIMSIKKQYPKLVGFVADVFLGKRLYCFPAIYLGNGHIFMVLDKGCKVMPYKFFKKHVIGIRRLIQ